MFTSITNQKLNSSFIIQTFNSILEASLAAFTPSSDSILFGRSVLNFLINFKKQSFLKYILLLSISSLSVGEHENFFNYLQPNEINNNK